MKTKSKRWMTALTLFLLFVCPLADACLEFCFVRSLVMLQEVLPIPKVLMSWESKLEAGLFIKNKNIRLMHRMCVCGQKGGGENYTEKRERKSLRSSSSTCTTCIWSHFENVSKLGLEMILREVFFALSPWRCFIIFALEGLFWKRKKCITQTSQICS